METGSGGKRSDRYKSRRSDKKKTRSARRSGKWYRRRAFLAAVPIALVLIGGGSALAYKSGVFSGSGAEAQTAVTTTTGAAPAEETATTAGAATTPLASAAEVKVGAMSLEEKIGQMMMVGFEGQAPTAEITEAIQKRHIGGVILFDRNIDSQEQVAGMNAALQQLAVDAKHPYKLMIAVDQEGGKTRRFTDIGPFYSQPMIGEMNDAAPDAAQQQASSAARGLKPLGFNTNLAPVADVSSGWGSVMDGRAFSSDTAFTAELTARAIKGYNNATTISCAKHFPGHGSAEEDSEDTLPTLSDDAETIQAADLPPFAAAIEAGAPMIMVGHLAVPAFDATGAPATLSRPMITDLLRGSMGFKGVVITDDMEMGAITETYSIGDAAVASVAAGADIVMVAHTAAAQKEAYDALIAAVKAGKIKEAAIDKSVIRIIEMKKKFRLEIPSTAAAGQPDPAAVTSETDPATAAPGEPDPAAAGTG